MRWRILILLRFGIAFLLTVDLGISLYIQHYEVNAYPNGNDNQYANYQGPIITQIIWPFLKTVGCFVLDNPELITAIATAFIAAYTIILARATKALTTLAEQQGETTQIHERAYLFGGGPTRVMKNVSTEGATALYMPVPDTVCMTITNWGRSTGFIKKVQWGLCPPREFRHNVSVSRLIDEKLLPPAILQTVTKDDIYPPTGMSSMPYRHVTFKQKENIGKIFFGRLFFQDIFGDSHHSTFKFELTASEPGSEPLEGCYSDDWD